MCHRLTYIAVQHKNVLRCLWLNSELISSAAHKYKGKHNNEKYNYNNGSGNSSVLKPYFSK